MITLFLFYWIVCGVASFALAQGNDAVDAILCGILGGFIVPAKLIVKVLQ